jgi:hypothetical protein
VTARENSRRRRAPFREPRTRVLIVCGGAVTEPGYFEGLKRAARNPAVRICVKKKALDPASLIEYAAALRDRDPDTFDEVWCVVDVDQFDMVAAVCTSRDRQVRLAISNPCFEIWLLLHFSDCRAAVNGAADAVRRLKRHVPQYSKSTLRFADFSAGVPEAITRARCLSDVGHEHATNPSTGVWVVAALIAGD